MEDYCDDIVEAICDVKIDCPACQNIEDDQYMCTYCWCMGGQGEINVANFIKENPNLFNITRED